MTSQTLSLLCCFRVYHCWIEVPSHFAKKMFILLSYLNVNLFRRAGSCRLHVHIAQSFGEWSREIFCKTPQPQPQPQVLFLIRLTPTFLYGCNCFLV
ncbi:hypothetical protein ACB092_10G015900 [Castanea dentata]